MSTTLDSMIAVPCAQEMLLDVVSQTRTQPTIVVINEMTIDPEDGFYSLRNNAAFDFWKNASEDLYEDE